MRDVPESNPSLDLASLFTVIFLIAALLSEEGVSSIRSFTTDLTHPITSRSPLECGNKMCRVSVNQLGTSGKAAVVLWSSSSNKIYILTYNYNFTLWGQAQSKRQLYFVKNKTRETKTRLLGHALHQQELGNVARHKKKKPIFSRTVTCILTHLFFLLSFFIAREVRR